MSDREQSNKEQSQSNEEQTNEEQSDKEQSNKEIGNDDFLVPDYLKGKKFLQTTRLDLTAYEEHINRPSDTKELRELLYPGTGIFDPEHNTFGGPTGGGFGQVLIQTDEVRPEIVTSQSTVNPDRVLIGIPHDQHVRPLLSTDPGIYHKDTMGPQNWYQGKAGYWRIHDDGHREFIPFHPRPGRQICGGAKRDGGICHSQNISLATGRCRHHEGHGMQGEAHHSYVDGSSSRYAKTIPHSLADAYEKSLSDTEILDLVPELSLLSARTNELLERLAENQTAEKRLSRFKVMRRLESAIHKQDWEETEQCLCDLKEIDSTFDSDTENWDEIRRIISDRARLVTVEQTRREKMQQTVHVSEMMILLQEIIAVVKKNEKDPATLNRIARDIRALVSGEIAGGSVTPGQLLGEISQRTGNRELRVDNGGGQSILEVPG